MQAINELDRKQPEAPRKLDDAFIAKLPQELREMLEEKKRQNG